MLAHMNYESPRSSSVPRTPASWSTTRRCTVPALKTVGRMSQRWTRRDPMGRCVAARNATPFPRTYAGAAGPRILGTDVPKRIATVSNADIRKGIDPLQLTAYTPGALAEMGYVCSACLKTPDVCACPYQERHGIEQKPVLVHRDTLAEVLTHSNAVRP